MIQKTQFIANYLRLELSVTELSITMGISRNSGQQHLPD